MRVGAVEETITVTGETPIVDVQNTRRQRVIDRETIDNIPTSRTAYDMAALIPGVSRGGLTSQDVGGSSSSGTPIGSVAIHGGRTGDQVVMRNGIETIGQSGNGFSTPVNINPVGTQEVNVDTASAGAEHTTGGVRINVIPREGGNTFNGAFFTSYASPTWQADNLTQELKDQGVSSADKLKDNYDINPGFGGPLKQDKLWFFVSARYKNSANYASGMYYDKNFNNPNVWVFEPDLDRPAANPSIWKGAQLRLTWQASQRNKFGVSLHEDSVSYAPTSVSQILAPEAAENRIYPVQRQRQVDWSSPVNNRILLEAGINRYKAASNLLPLSGLSPDMVPATEQSTGLKFRSLETHRLQPALTTHTRFSASYITGAHAMKVGTNLTRGWNGFTYGNLSPVSYRLNNAIPNQISQRAFPILTDTNMDQLGVYAQDKWTINRLTAAYGVRFSRVTASSPEQHLGPSIFTPTRDLDFAPLDNFLSWNDLTPHLGAVYDVFGTGRTAVKVSLNRYLENLSAGSCHRAGPESAEHDHHPDDAVVERREPQLRAGLQPPERGGQRRMRRDGQLALRPAGAGQHLRPGADARVEQAGLQLGVLERRAARSDDAHVGGRQLLPPRLRQLPGHRQPRPRPGGLRQVRRHGPGGSAPAGRRRLRRARHVQPQSREVRPGVGQPGDPCEQLRRPGRVLARRRRQHRDAPHPRPDAPGRHQHRPHGAGRLRAPGEGARAGGIARHLGPHHHGRT